MSKENKLFEVIRKHPNKDAKFDLSIGGNYYKKGEKIGYGIFVKTYGNEDTANKAIKKYLDNKWIKEFSAKQKKETENEKVTNSNAIAK